MQVVITDKLSIKLCEAAVCLLAHFAEQELRGWPQELLPEQQGQQGQQGEQQGQQGQQGQEGEGLEAAAE
jgi:hypothetical protein